jgi:hypothetical protein
LAFVIEERFPWCTPRWAKAFHGAGKSSDGNYLLERVCSAQKSYPRLKKGTVGILYCKFRYLLLADPPSEPVSTAEKFCLYSRQRISLGPEKYHRKYCQNDTSVTTTHLFWPKQRRKAAWPIPNWLRNLCVLAWTGQHPPGGRSTAGHAAKASTEKCTRNFMANGSPTPLAWLPKKRASKTRRNAEPAVSSELVANDR